MAIDHPITACFSTSIGDGSRAALLSSLSAEFEDVRVGLDLGDRGPVIDSALVAATLILSGALTRVGEEVTESVIALIKRARWWKTSGEVQVEGEVQVIVEAIALVVIVDQGVDDAAIGTIAPILGSLDIDGQPQTVLQYDGREWKQPVE